MSKPTLEYSDGLAWFLKANPTAGEVDYDYWLKKLERDYRGCQIMAMREHIETMQDKMSVMLEVLESMDESNN